MAAPDGNIQVFNETSFDLPLLPAIYEKVAQTIANQEECSFHFIEVVYVDEDEIVRINKEHLDRDYITDIISFRYDSEDGSSIEGTLYCCAPRIIEQSEDLGEPLKREFMRIFIHGLLHLAGYNDQSVSEKEKMTALEERYLETAFE